MFSFKKRPDISLSSSQGYILIFKTYQLHHDILLVTDLQVMEIGEKINARRCKIPSTNGAVKNYQKQMKPERAFSGLKEEIRNS